MITHKATRIVALTMELAQEFATMPEWRGERALRKKRMRFLRGRLESGLFHAPRWAFAWFGHSRYRMNGQHSSNLLVDAGDKFPAGMCAVIDEFVCDTEEDLCTLFSQFDAPESSRGTSDVVNAHASIHSELNNASTVDVTRAVAGIAVAQNEGVSPRLSREDRARLVHEHTDFIVWVAELIRTREFYKSGVVGAIFATWERNPAVALGFWRLVRDESHSDPHDSTRVLGKWLQRITFDRADPETGRNWSTHAVYTKCLHAWNAYRANKRTNLKYHRGVRAPIAM